MQRLGKYSFGVGDRFAHQAAAQLSAFLRAKEHGVLITPVWNKSYREHQIIQSDPSETRKQADLAVKEKGWQGAYFVDADHVSLKSVDFFIDSSDFFTIDVADFIGEQAAEKDIDHFVRSHQKYFGQFSLPGITEKFIVDQKVVENIARNYLKAVQEAAAIYRRILRSKDQGSFVVEVSMDETDQPQSPLEIFFILSGLKSEGVPLATIAPKFSGRFNKGIDYVGDLDLFKKEFEQDLAVLRYAVSEFSLTPGLKLSIHSGSDKFSLYPVIGELIRKYDAGLHIKTAGTTWLEELIGLALAGNEGLQLAKKIYQQSLQRSEELCAPYASVIDIKHDDLPTVDEINAYSGKQFAQALRHDPSCPEYNPNLRQLLHVGYKVAAELKEEYLPALEKNAAIIGQQVIENIFERHMKPLFGI